MKDLGGISGGTFDWELFLCLPGAQNALDMWVSLGQSLD